MNIKIALCYLCVSGIVPPAYALEPGATIPRTDDLPAGLPSATAIPDLELPAPLTPAQAGHQQTLPRFVLEEVVFSGNQVFKDADLKQVVSAWLGWPVSRIDLETLRFKLAHYYRQAGYINSGVLLPKQHIVNGRVRYQIVEGHLGAIQIKNAEGLSDRYIQSRLQNAPDEPLNQPQLLERFQLLLTDPLIEHLNGALKPGARPDESLLDLTVTRRQPYALNLGFDNYTTPSVGAYTGRLDGVVRNLTGWGDFLQLDLNYSEGLQGLGSLFSLPIAAGGTRLNLNFQGNQAEITDNALKPLAIQNDFYHLSAGLSHPLYLSMRRSFTIEEQFAYRYTRNFILGEPLGLASGSEDNGKAKVSVFRFLQNYVDRSPDRVFSLRSTFSAGVDGLNATINQAQADSRFFSWLGQGRYVQHLSENGTELFFRGDVQIASEALLPVERFALGGVYTVRGYRQNELVRDNGYVLSTELRYPLLKADNEQEHTLKLVPFADYGGAWNRNYAERTLWSLGLGLQWNWRTANADFYWAHAMNNADTTKQQGDIQDDGIHFRVAVKLL